MELKSVWMSRDAARKSRFALHAVGGVVGIVALVMALDRAMKNQSGGSVYDERGLLFI